MFESVDPAEGLAQGDIIDQAQLLSWQWKEDEQVWKSAESIQRVIVLTQSCDLEVGKADRLTVANVHDAQKLVDRGIISAAMIRDNVRRHRVYGWYFLPRSVFLTESLVDLREIHTLPRAMIELLIANGHRVCRLMTPYREHLAQHFSVTYSRIGLPEPYATE
jgi:hypothetical protein